MSSMRPRLVSFYRLKGPDDEDSQGSSGSESSSGQPRYKFFIRYNPSDYTPLSVKDRNRILVNYFFKPNSSIPLDKSRSTSPISPTENTSSSSPRGTKPESLTTETSIKSPESEKSSKHPSPRIPKHSPSPREARLRSPERISLPREARQRSPKRPKLIEQEVPMVRQRRTASAQGNSLKPRWQRHDMIVYIALCNIPGQVACRAELLKAAIELDRKISKEKGIPHVFKGKTPHNSASACLTMNKDNLFKRIYVPGQSRQYFGLAYPTGNFDLAVQRYKAWEEKLYRVFYPIAFAPEDSEDENSVDEANCDTTSTEDSPRSDLEATVAAFPDPSKALFKAEDASQPEGCPRGESFVKTSSYAAKTLPAAIKKPSGKIPTSWKDILEVRASSIPAAGMGLFSKAFIPADTTIGYYFGTPLTEYDFDRTKDKVGLASHYSIMYQYMVLDATDENGMPFTDPEGPIFCPFHFMNEDKNKVNAAFHEGSEYNQISCQTLVDIHPGQELFVYYGTEFERDHYTI